MMKIRIGDIQLEGKVEEMIAFYKEAFVPQSEAEKAPKSGFGVETPIFKREITEGSFVTTPDGEQMYVVSISLYGNAQLAEVGKGIEVSRILPVSELE